jgi:hypothetical protein
VGLGSVDVYQSRGKLLDHLQPVAVQSFGAPRLTVRSARRPYRWTLGACKAPSAPVPVSIRLAAGRGFSVDCRDVSSVDAQVRAVDVAGEGARQKRDRSSDLLDPAHAAERVRHELFHCQALDLRPVIAPSALSSYVPEDALRSRSDDVGGEPRADSGCNERLGRALQTPARCLRRQRGRLLNTSRSRIRRCGRADVRRCGRAEP